MNEEASQTELVRLRTLLGPGEKSYGELLTDVEVARNVAKAALAETGALRGRVVELERELVRARRNARFLEELVLRPARAVVRGAQRLRPR
jgi:hypothetical protein